MDSPQYVAEVRHLAKGKALLPFFESRSKKVSDAYGQAMFDFVKTDLRSQGYASILVPAFSGAQELIAGSKSSKEKQKTVRL